MAKQSATLIAQLLQEINTAKTAAIKRAEPLSEPGSQGGATAHISKDVDDGLVPVKEGDLAAMNARDVKESVPASVEAAPEAKAEASDAELLEGNIGTRQSTVGEDPKTEDAYKERPKDPGTTHPANLNQNDKYSYYKQLPPQELISRSVDRADQMLAKVATHKAKQAAAPTGAGAAASAPATDAEHLKAAQEGYELARQLGAAQRGTDMLYASVAEASHMADLVGQFLTSHAKQAGSLPMDDDGGDEPPMPEGEAGSGGFPPGAGGLEGVDDGAGAGDGGEPDEAALREFIAALLQHGVSPEELMQMIQQDAGAVGGRPEGPPGGGGLRPGGLPPEALGAPGPKIASEDRWQLARIAKSAVAMQRAGRFKLAAPVNSKAAEMRQEMHSYLGELLHKLNPRKFPAVL